MEDIASDLDLVETKQSNLGRAYESLNLQAFTFMQLGLQWNELEDYLNSTRAKISTRFNELQTREAQIDDRLKKLEALEKEAVYSKSHLESIKVLIQENSEELSVKEKRFSEIEEVIRVKERVIEERGRRLGDAEGRIGRREKRVRVLEGVLGRLSGEIRKKRRELGLRGEEVRKMERLVERCDEELRLKWGEIDGLEGSILEFSERVKAKEGVIREMEMRVKELREERSKNVEMVEERERRVEEKAKEVELREKEIAPRVEELGLIRKRVDECVNEAQVKVDRDFRSLEEWKEENVKWLEERERSVQERCREVEMKERRVEEREKELELKEKQLDCMLKASGEKMKLKEKASIIHPIVKVQHLEHKFANNVAVPSTASNAKCLHLIMSEHLKRIDLMSREVSAVLQASTDPAGLVLDAMQGFYPTNSKTVDNMEFDSDLKVIRRSCIVLLQELKRFSPQIYPQVRQKAMKLAAEWKAKLTVTTENRLEVLGFLRLVATYELSSMYDPKELHSLVSLVVQPEHATELFQALNVSDKAHATSTCSFPLRIKGPESSVAKCAVPFPFPNLQLTATREATNSTRFIADRLGENNSVQDKMLAANQGSPDPAQIVLEMMQSSFAQCWREGGFCSDVTVMKSYIDLLETLVRMSKNIRPCVKEDARKLSVQWKAKLRVDAGNSLEILLFLQFITTYELLFTMNGGDIVNLLGVVSQHRQARELCQALVFANKIPGFIRNLIERKQILDAVRCICVFMLIDKFSAVQLLKDLVHNTRKYASEIWKTKLSFVETEKAVDGLIGDLRAVHQCIKDCKLESEYPYTEIELQVVQLESLKEHHRILAPSLASCSGSMNKIRGKGRD